MNMRVAIIMVVNSTPVEFCGSVCGSQKASLLLRVAYVLVVICINGERGEWRDTHI